jgi:hypothetical protein
VFPPEEERMYYFIREGYAATDFTGYDRHKEGYAK